MLHYFYMGVIRTTKSVKALLAIFKEHNVAFSSAHLVEMLKMQMNKTTVYRALERLEDEGLLHSFIGKDGLKWFAKCKACSSQNHTDNHPHFQCNTCGKVECLPLGFDLPYLPKYQIDSANLILTGKCKKCLS